MALSILLIAGFSLLARVILSLHDIWARVIHDVKRNSNKSPYKQKKKLLKDVGGGAKGSGYILPSCAPIVSARPNWYKLHNKLAKSLIKLYAYLPRKGEAGRGKKSGALTFIFHHRIIGNSCIQRPAIHRIERYVALNRCVLQETAVAVLVKSAARAGEEAEKSSKETIKLSFSDMLISVINRCLTSARRQHSTPLTVRLTVAVGASD